MSTGHPNHKKRKPVNKKSIWKLLFSPRVLALVIKIGTFVYRLVLLLLRVALFILEWFGGP